MRVDDMGMHEEEEEGGDDKIHGTESPDQSDEVKATEKEWDKAYPRKNEDLDNSNKKSADYGELSLNTEATYLYDSLLGQIDELLGLYPSFFFLPLSQNKY